ncbi:MAG: methionyl-tRNA formyltransferase [Clostridia bacterium]|nr:methionyl-tRNA formyltransferase [Clostridia bacterium]
MRIVFMGTPDYAEKTLKALYGAGHEIIAVFAQPDKPVGRKQIITMPPVKVFAVGHNIPVFQPNTLRDENVIKQIKELNPDLIAVVAYGKILPKEILSIPKLGCVNGHGSLLPLLRGASPIQWAIVSGFRETGVTTMFMDEGMDTGDILLTKKTPIEDDETAEQLFERMGDITASLMVETVEKLEKGEITPVKQDNTRATYAPIIKKEMALIDFNEPGKAVYNKIRGFYSWPCAYFMLNGKRVKVISAKPYGKTDLTPGKVVKGDNRLVISCGDNNAIEMTTVQMEGKKAMKAADMLNGNPLPYGQTVN